MALIVYGAVILVGSVHLGWHYAVDGYAGIVMAMVAWWLAGPIVARWDRTEWVRSFSDVTPAKAGAPLGDPLN